MSDVSGTEFTLEMLSGLHRGVIQCLPVGEYTLGNCASCDLILSDASIAERHCRLELDDEGLLVTPLDGVLSIDGKELAQTVRLTQFPAYLQMGLVTVALEVQLLPPKTPRERLQRSWSSLTQRKPPVSEAFGEQPELQETSTEARSWGGLLQGGAQRLVLLALVVAMLGAVFILAGNGVSDVPPNRDEEWLLKRQLASLDVPARSLRFSPLADQWDVTVFREEMPMPVGQLRDQLLDVLEQRSDVHVRVIDAQSLLAKVRAAMAKFDYPVTARGQQGGVIILSGWVETVDQLQQLAESIRADVPDVAELETEAVMVASTALASLRQRLSEEGVPLRVQRNGSVVEAQGELPAEHAAAWERVSEDFLRQYGEHLSLRGLPVFSELPRLQVKGIWQGTPPYVILEDGQIYFEGTRLDDGWTLTAITPDALRLERGNEKADYEF